MSKKVLKRKKNKPYIVTHWHASLNQYRIYRFSYVQLQLHSIHTIFNIE
jgi:hypothetical protein